MASNWSTCGVCDYRHITKPSVVWCSECDEGLCGDCNEHHSISRASRNHEAISIAEYKKLPKKIIEIATVCKIHNEKYELFCRKHDCPCCKKCVNSHNDCKGLTDIDELIKNVKTSNAFYEIEQTLLEVAENIKLIKTNREDNLTSLEKQKREIEEEIKQTRSKINHRLDELQDELLKELTATEQKESSKIQSVLATLKQKEKDITKNKANVADIKQHASKLQTYLVMKHIENEIAIEEQFIQSLSKSDTTNQVKISCQINNSLQQFTTSLQKFGVINVCSDPSNLSIQLQKQKQAQIMVVVPARNIDNLTLTLQKRVNTKLTDIRGCCMIPDGKFVFSDIEGKIKVLKTDGSTDFEIDVADQIFDVVYIGDDCIAVTSGNSTSIFIIDLKKNKRKKTIQINSNSFGVEYKNEQLIYCVKQKGLQMISLIDESITNGINITFSSLAYVTSFVDKLLYTDYEDDSVTCCDYQGNILWTFCDKSVLHAPCGISVDNDGNVFVAGYVTSNVVAISPDGQRCRQLLSTTDGIENPECLHYDTSTDQLLVANSNDIAFLYDVK